MLITAIILSGGQSSRMGKDKALLPFWGKTIIEHVQKSLFQLTDKFLISANSQKYSFLKKKIVSDVYTNQGPLAGLHATLHETQTDLALVASCDAPLVTPKLFSYLLEHFQPGVDAVIAVHKGRQHPLIGVYAQSNADKIGKFLEQGERSVMHYLANQEVRYVEIDESLPFYSELLFLNMNEPEDYQKLLVMEAGIKVLYFGITSDIAGKPQEFLPKISSVADLKSTLFTSYPELKEQKFTVSVNRIIANDSFKLYEGDEIALLPPYAGG